MPVDLILVATLNRSGRFGSAGADRPGSATRLSDRRASATAILAAAIRSTSLFSQVPS